MTERKNLPARMTSGVPGLDRVLAGGFFETGVYIIEGPAGAGKTILANQICYHVARQEKRAVYYTLLTEAHDRMLGFLSTLGFFEPKHVPERVSYVSGFKVLESEGLAGTSRSIREVLGSRKPAVLVVDGLVSAEEIAPSDTAFKKFIHELQTISGMYRCTVILLANTESGERIRAEHTMVDGIIELAMPIVRLKPQRFLEVIKFRGGAQLRGTHTLEITADGVAVRPRIETLLSPQPHPSPRTTVRRPFGIPALDAMLQGGLPDVSNTLALGPSGVGKTVLGLHWVAAGLGAREKAIFFTFYEQPQVLVAKAAAFGIDLAGPLERGDLAILWASSVEANVDRIGGDLVRHFDELQPARVFIDGMHGFQATADAPERIQDFFAALSDYFISRGATLLFSCESEDLIGDPIRPPFPNASRMTQNILLLRYVEHEGVLTKIISVVKMRDSTFDPSLRTLRFTGGGIVIGDPIRGADGLLSGHARRVGSDDGEAGG